MTTTTNKLLTIILLLNITITTLHSDIINQLSNKNLMISGYFFSSNKSSYFLRYINENNSSLWLYTKQRKFKPIHNTKAYDGYNKADSIFKSITIDTNHSINISSIINDDNSLYKDILNKTFTPTHLLLKDNNKNYNILTNKNATSLWEYKNRKYRPIHNARAFDGYEEAKKIFDDINITKDNIIHIGDIDTVNYTSFKAKEYSLNNTRAIRIIKSIDYKDNFIKLTDNLIKDKANELIWQNNNDGKLRTYEEAKQYCENLEVDGYKGFRVPNGIEVTTLLNENIDNTGLSFVNIKPNIEYWARYNKNQFIINDRANKDMFLELDTSFGMNDLKSKAHNKCVYGKELTNPIFIRKNNAIIDSLNNLMWQDNLEIRNEQHTHSLAVSYCKNLQFLQYNDWRLPNYKELATLLKNNHQLNAINVNAKTYDTYIPQGAKEKSKTEIAKWVDALHTKYKLRDFRSLKDIMEQELGFSYKYRFNERVLDIGSKEYLRRQNKHHIYLVNNISKETIKDIYQTDIFMQEVKKTKKEHYDLLRKYENAIEFTAEEYEGYLDDISKGEWVIGGRIIKAMPPIPSLDILYISKELESRIEADGNIPRAILKSKINNLEDIIKEIPYQNNYFNISTLYKLLMPYMRSNARAFWTVSEKAYFSFDRISSSSSISGRAFCVRDNSLAPKLQIGRHPKAGETVK